MAGELNTLEGGGVAGGGVDKGTLVEEELDNKEVGEPELGELDEELEEELELTKDGDEERTEELVVGEDAGGGLSPSEVEDGPALEGVSRPLYPDAVGKISV